MLIDIFQKVLRESQNSKARHEHGGCRILEQRITPHMWVKRVKLAVMDIA
jgi:hypothetical protein